MRKPITAVVVVLACVLWARVAYSAAPPGNGFGVCHWPAPEGMSYSNAVNWFYWGGGAEDWSYIEPTRDVYTFDPLKKQLDTHFARWPNSYFWLDVMTAMPRSVPQWAKDDRLLQYTQFEEKTSVFPIWNPHFRKEFEELLTKTSEYVHSPQFAYKQNLKAVIMMAGGPYGEMISWSNCPNGPRCSKYKSIGYTDEVYIDSVLNWLAPLYLRLFPEYPIIVQVAGGIDGKDVLGRITRPLVDTYGSRIQLKWNGWNHYYADAPTSTDILYHNHLKSLAGKTRVGFEPRNIPNTSSAADAQAFIKSMNKTLGEMPVSYFCLQRQYFSFGTQEQFMTFTQQMSGLQGQFTAPPPPTTAPTAIPSPTSQPTSAPATPTRLPKTLPTNTTLTVTIPIEIPPTSAPLGVPTETSNLIPSSTTPPSITPSTELINIPKAPRKVPNIKDMVCTQSNTASHIVGGIVSFPARIGGEIVAIDQQLESSANAWIRKILSRQ